MFEQFLYNCFLFLFPIMNNQYCNNLLLPVTIGQDKEVPDNIEVQPSSESRTCK